MQVVGDDVGIRQSVRRILKMAHQQRVVAPLLDHVAADMAVRLVHRVEARRRMPLPNRVEQLSVQIPIECAGSAQEFSAERGQAVDVVVAVQIRQRPAALAAVQHISLITGEGVIDAHHFVFTDFHAVPFASRVSLR